MPAMTVPSEVGLTSEADESWPSALPDRQLFVQTALSLGTSSPRYFVKRRLQMNRFYEAIRLRKPLVTGG